MSGKSKIERRCSAAPIERFLLTLQLTILGSGVKMTRKNLNAFAGSAMERARRLRRFDAECAILAAVLPRLRR